jgi:hypothetical protein
MTSTTTIESKIDFCWFDSIKYQTRRSTFVVSPTLFLEDGQANWTKTRKIVSGFVASGVVKSNPNLLDPIPNGWGQQCSHGEEQCPVGELKTLFGRFGEPFQKAGRGLPPQFCAHFSPRSKLQYSIFENRHEKVNFVVQILDPKMELHLRLAPEKK